MDINLSLFKYLIDEINDAIFIIEPATSRFLYVNDKASENLGYDKEELLNMKVLDIEAVIPDNFSWEKHVGILKENTHIYVDGRHKRKDGTSFPVEVNVKYVTIEGTDYIVTVARDVTVRKEREKSLQNHVHGLSTLFKISKTLAESLETSHVLQASVEGAAELVGLSTAAIYLIDGDNLALQATTPPLPPDFPDELRITPLKEHPHIGRSITACTPVYVENLQKEYQTEAERQVAEQRNLYSLLIVPLILGQEAIGAFIVGSNDKQTDIPKDTIELSSTLGNLVALTLKNSQLYEKVHDYAAELEVNLNERIKAEKEQEKLQDQLLQAQRMESIGRLAGGVAHDFNNMLGVIFGYSELILGKISPDHDFYNNLKQIKDAAERSANLTRQLLAFARKQTVSPEVINLNTVISDMLKMLKRLIGENIDLEWMPAEDLGSVKMDPSQVDQILANLCVNARDAIPDTGKIKIETGNAVFDEEYCRDHPGFIPGQYVMMAISDNGCGMDQGLVANIFEPYFSTKEAGIGTGLGLSTVYGIVKQNKGFIDLESAPGRGTTFKIYLRRHDGDSSRSSERADVRDTPGGSETILLVEDEAMILDLAKRHLTSLGYRVLSADHPTEALNLAKAHGGRIDLLITDVIMPEMNGRELADLLLSDHEDLKVIYMSGYTSNVIAHHGVLEEGISFLGKPFSLAELANKVRETIEK